MNKSKIIAILRQDMFAKIIPLLGVAPAMFEAVAFFPTNVSSGYSRTVANMRNGETYVAFGSIFDENGTKLYEEIDMFYKMYGFDIKTVFGAAQLIHPEERECMELSVRQNATMAEIKKAIQERMRTDTQQLMADVPGDNDSEEFNAMISIWRIKGIWT